MADFYERLNQTARRLIKQYGKPATLVRQTQTGPEHDPTIVEAEYDIVMVETKLGIENRSDTLIEVGDRAGIISTDGEAPQFSDKITLDSQRHNFVSLEPLSPGATTLLYTFVARA